MKQKLDKKKEQAAARAVRMKQHRLLLKAQAQREEKPSGCLRQLQSCEDAPSIKYGGGVARVVKWAPKEGSVVEVDRSAGESYPAPAPRSRTRAVPFAL